MIKSVLKAEEKLWREVARRVVEMAEEKGLCAYVDDVDPMVRQATARERSYGHLGDNTWAYADRPSWTGSFEGYQRKLREHYAEHREARCLAALWMAEEAADEARSVT